MQGNLDQQQIEEVLKKQIIGRIGCHWKDTTYVVPISYAYDGEHVYARTQEGMKIEMMRNNPNVCFEVEDMEDMANWRSVIVWGKFEELTDPELRKAGIEKLLNRVVPVKSSITVQFSPNWPFHPSDTERIEGIIFRILLDKKTGRFEHSDAGAGYYAS